MVRDWAAMALDDLEAFPAQVVLDVAQVVLGLLGGKIRGKSLEKFLGGYEAALPAPVAAMASVASSRLIGSWSAAADVSSV
jgi:hypothetical protein